MSGIAGTLPRGGRAHARPLRLVLALIVFALGALPVQADDVVVTVADRDEVFEVRGRFTTRTTADSVWRVLTDYSGIPRFVRSMKQSVVEARDGARVRVRQVASIGVFPMRRTAHLVLDVLEHEPQRIAFSDTLGEDFRLYAGSWELRSDSAGTMVAYSLDATPKAAVPGWIGRSMMRHAASDLLRQVHAEIERRAIAPRPAGGSTVQ